MKVLRVLEKIEDDGGMGVDILITFFKLMTQTTRKDKLSSPHKSRTYDLLVTSADALSLSYRGFMEAKLGSCEETSCILLGLERPYVTYAVGMIETRCSTSETRGK